MDDQPIADTSNKNMDIEALVASGDCLEALASSIDALNHHEEMKYPELEDIVRTLLYLQRNYKLTVKQRNF